MSKGKTKKRGPRRGRGSITNNRAGNWPVFCTDPYGKFRAGILGMVLPPSGSHGCRILSTKNLAFLLVGYYVSFQQ